MGRIHLLDDDVINKIAAGEVVERPASVVKELVENALDAGATAIEVALELGGSRSIAVTDDGLGMSGEDATAALRRHATSKIKSADDLFNIGTMGFRGEALASIAAISRFTLATTERGAEAGVKLTVQGGELAGTLPWPGRPGTTVIVENLFYNVPVRAKFLKAPSTELSHCLELMQAFALCHPAVGLSLKHNGREVFRAAALPPGDDALAERARSVLGKDAIGLTRLKTSSRHGDLEALISPPGVEKASGKHLYLFVNGRWVKDKVLRYGVLRGYHSHLLKGRFPVVVLHLKLDPSLVDVNVHPAKTEVRFQYPDEVQSQIALAIRAKLRDAGWASPPVGDDDPLRPGAVRKPQPLAAASLAPPAVERRLLPRDAGGTSEASMSGPYAGARRMVGAPARHVQTTTTRSFGAASAGEPATPWAPAAVTDKASIDALLAGESPTEVIPWDELEYLGAFDKCYLLFAAEGRLLAVDQHAFHERVLFERLTRDARLLRQSQPLLVPEALELSPSEVATLRARWTHLAPRGFDYQADGETTVLVRGVPSLLAGRNLADLFADLGRDLAADDAGEEPTDSNAEMARLILAKAACHAAVRAGEDLPPNELKQLLAEARTVDFFHNCPHGRRVFRWWSRAQVARWFDR